MGFQVFLFCLKKVILIASLVFAFCHSSMVVAQPAPRVIGGSVLPDVAPQGLDACDLSDTSDRVFAIENSCDESTNDITAVGNSENVDVSDPPAVVGSPVVQEPPVVV